MQYKRGGKLECNLFVYLFILFGNQRTGMFESCLITAIFSLPKRSPLSCYGSDPHTRRLQGVDVK